MEMQIIIIEGSINFIKYITIFKLISLLRYLKIFYSHKNNIMRKQKKKIINTIIARVILL